jgi:hypothetical protein
LPFELVGKVRLTKVDEGEKWLLGVGLQLVFDPAYLLARSSTGPLPCLPVLLQTVVPTAPGHGSRPAGEVAELVEAVDDVLAVSRQNDACLHRSTMPDAPQLAYVAVVVRLIGEHVR